MTATESPSKGGEEGQIRRDSGNPAHPEYKEHSGDHYPACPIRPQSTGKCGRLRGS